jgi:hypothetical protein
MAMSTPVKKSIGRPAVAFTAPWANAGAQGLRVSRYSQLINVPKSIVKTIIINTPMTGRLG